MTESEISLQRQLDAICDEFEESWKKDQPPNFGKFLVRVDDAHRDRLLRNLIEIDLELRQKYSLEVDSSDFESLGPKVVHLVESILHAKQGSTRPTIDIPPEDEISTLPPQKIDSEGPFRRIDNYELMRLLGTGGMGQVYLARHHKFRDRLYALKLLKANIVNDEAMARFEHEIDVTGRLQHPNIVFAVDAGRSDNEPYLVMEYIKGHDLQAIVEEQGTLEVKDACEIIRQAADGLEYAFQKAEITHRDIKPANLMLSANGQVKVLDLGLARLREQSQVGGMTQEGQVLGTPDYMAPEQWNESRKVTTTADVYSLGCSLFTLLTGKPPFYSEQKSSIASKMSAHLLDEPPKVRQLCDDVPTELEDIVARCLAKEPGDRYQSPGELAEALSAFVDDADLTVYADTDAIGGAESLLPTYPVGNRNESTKPGTIRGKKNSQPSFNWPLILSVFSLVAVVSILGAYAANYFINGNSGGQASNDDTPELMDIPTTDVEIAVLHLVKERLENGAEQISDYGLINGSQDATTLVVREYHHSRMEVLFPRKCYALVFAILPSVDGSSEVPNILSVWPDNDTAENGQLLSGLMLPTRPIGETELEFESYDDVGETGLAWEFSDGYGMHAFVVVHSDEPLPQFATVKEKLKEMKWPARTAKMRNWKIINNRAFIHIAKQNKVRGYAQADGFDLQPIVEKIRSIFPNADIDGIVFNVEQKIEQASD